VGFKDGGVEYFYDGDGFMFVFCGKRMKNGISNRNAEDNWIKIRVRKEI
jgi:hypothetical protein